MRINVVESKARIQPMGVSRSEQANTKSVNTRMFDRRFDHELAEAETARSDVDEYIAEPRERRLVGYPACETHLTSLGFVTPNHN